MTKRLESARAALRCALTALDGAADAIDRSMNFLTRAGRRDVAVRHLERIAAEIRSARDLAELKGARAEALVDDE